MPLLLTERDVRAVLPMADLIAAMERALAEYSARRVVQPVRTVLEVGSQGGLFGVMPAALDDPPVMGAKLVTVYHGNHERGLPSHLATIVVLDHDDRRAGRADGRPLHHRSADRRRLGRVGEAPGAAGRRVLAIIGTGVQARSHLEAIRHVRSLTEVRVWSPNARAPRGVRRGDERRDWPCRFARRRRRADAVRGADIVVLATASPTPVIEDADVAAGAHIAASARAGRISARCRRRSWRARESSSIRAPAR